MARLNKMKLCIGALTGTSPKLKNIDLYNTGKSLVARRKGLQLFIR